MIEHRDGKGRLIATEADKPGEIDMIAQWLLHGDLEPESAADELLVPVPFSLVCADCFSEADSAINSKVEATTAGWVHLEFTPEDAGNNYQGQCPRCRKEEEGGK